MLEGFEAKTTEFENEKQYTRIRYGTRVVFNFNQMILVTRVEAKQLNLSIKFRFFYLKLNTRLIFRKE